jgi:hypothetical protein
MHCPHRILYHSHRDLNCPEYVEASPGENRLTILHYIDPAIIKTVGLGESKWEFSLFTA